MRRDATAFFAHGSLALASVMESDFAGGQEGAHRKTMLALQQIIILGQLAVTRVLENIGAPGDV
ncbi:hypothetical protein D3C87_2052040 [compost metagenome]